ncbi:hypothetical protein [Streptacidiphilus sp. EB129]|uniref:hypothetical protein n=1 Tax=Streptacidiphilus sp. EB129 TaxID=3156262 RepID=UPI0035110682
MPADSTASTSTTASPSSSPGTADRTVEPLAEARRCLDDLDRALRASWARHGAGSALDVRRVRADLAHLRESFDVLCASSTGSTAPTVRVRPGPDVIEIPDTPYDPAMWHDADDEGIGCRHS